MPAPLRPGTEDDHIQRTGGTREEVSHRVDGAGGGAQGGQGGAVEKRKGRERGAVDEQVLALDEREVGVVALQLDRQDFHAADAWQRRRQDVHLPAVQRRLRVGKVGGRVEALPQRLTDDVDGAGGAQAGDYFVVSENSHRFEDTQGV